MKEYQIQHIKFRKEHIFWIQNRHINLEGVNNFEVYRLLQNFENFEFLYKNRVMDILFLRKLRLIMYI